MSLRQAAWLGIRVLTGLLSAGVSLHAVYSAIAVDFRFNPVLTFLYCLLPGISFFVFLFVRSPRTETMTQIAIFVGYVAAASLLGWRNCSAYGYCTSVTSAVLSVLGSRPVLASLAVAALTLLAWPSVAMRKGAASV